MAAFCLNLCEVLYSAMVKEDRLDEIVRLVKKKNQIEEPLERIYAGSSFCSQYFLHSNWWEHLVSWCRKKEVPLTLTLPVFTQKDLEKGKEKVEEILTIAGDVLDEITVNDVGMLCYISSGYEKKLNMGRLFFKDSRDVRVRDYDKGEMTPSLLTHDVEQWSMGRKIHAVELDTMSRYVNLGNCHLEDVELCVHGPFCYMTTGNICKFASIHKETEQKFRPNASCSMECAGIYEHYRRKFAERDTDVVRFGRTVYYLNNESRIVGKGIGRKLYFPLREAKEVMRGGKA
ncbi:MAG: hypothetical protein Q4D60_00740 [Eubacteriales bacterium]|nr:hypothetical protein [Eubacteriales bacterium]